MTTIKTSAVLVDFSGNPLKESATEGSPDLTAGTALANILAGKTSNPSLSWGLGRKFATEKSVELKAEARETVLRDGREHAGYLHNNITIL